ncbi:hypothetical protein RB195_019801 [Necator americanus]|uniref:Phospholipase A2 n=1 Tax=Necator americanus TaxID=51031 RepID=A0ABR1CHT5_NECAM
MLTAYFFLILLPLALSGTVPPNHFLNPINQALWNFGNMGKCVLRYNPIIFNHYGCWCGMGGGYEPIDENDRCCMIHDNCYDEAVESGKCVGTLWQYISSYKWDCVKGKAVCAPNQTSCKAAICECDLAVVNCWAKQPKPNRKEPCHLLPPKKTTETPPV